MSTKRSAQIHTDHNLGDIITSMSLFVRNHKDPEQLFTQLKALYSSGQVHEVTLLIECIINEYNDNIQNAELYILAAQVELELSGFNERAEAYIQQAIKIAPYNDTVMAFYKLIVAARDLKDGLYEKGEKCLRGLIEITSLRPFASYLLGHHLFWKTNDNKEAIDLLETVVEQNVHFNSAWADLALAYKRQGERVKANFALQKCLKFERNPSRRTFFERQIERH